MAMDRRTSGGYLPLRQAMEHLLEGSVIGPSYLSTAAGGSFPPVDVYLTEEDLILDTAIPGANPDDINISVTGDTVTLSGEIKHPHQSQKGQSYLDEVWHGKFQRSFTLPVQVDADKAQANFDNGILELRLPKSEATRPRKIQVTQQRQQGTIQQEAQSAEVQRESVPVNQS